jgi:recombination protein RecT
VKQQKDRPPLGRRLFALQTIRKSPHLQKADPVTVQNAIVNVAAVGLTLNPADGYAYLVPEYNTQTKCQECQLRISFKGLVKAATASGVIEWVKAVVVKAADDFRYKGPTTMPVHECNPFSADRGETIGVYCVAHTAKGADLVEVMDRAEIERCKAAAKTKLVWDNWFDEMAKKAVVKRAAKLWPKTEDSGILHKTIEVINDAEGGLDDQFAELEETAQAVLAAIEAGDMLAIGEVWCECSEEEQRMLWRAKTKGGWFTMEEKNTIRAAESIYKEAIANNDAPEGE